MSDVPRPSPARPERLKVRFEQSGDRLWIVYRTRGAGGGCFLVFWLIGWTVGCVFLAGQAIQKPELFLLLFAVPFWASWVFVFVLVLKMFFQCEEFLLDGEGAVFLRRVFIPIQRRETPLAEIREFVEYSKVTDSENGRRVYGLEMRTLGQPLRFCEGLDAPEREWLICSAQEHLARLQELYGESPPPVTAADVTASEIATDQATDVAESFDTRFAHGRTASCQPPSDARWQREDDFDSVAFTQRGRLAASSVFGLLFINLFWNGIVSVFLFQLFGSVPNGPKPQGAEWWGLFVFLIPFEAIGLLMFAGLIAAVLEPLRRTRWRFGRSDIECQWKWLGIGRSRSYSINELERVDLREDRSADKGQTSPRVALGGFFSPGSFRLSLVDRSNREVCSIRGLTEGEARWMADVIRSERSIWFR